MVAIVAYLLLITTLLDSPALCWTRMAGCEARADAAADDCCGESESRCPQEHEGDDDHRDCFCRGAVMATVGQQLVWDLAPDALALDCVPLALAEVADFMPQAMRTTVHFPPQATGRRLRALIVSRLI